MSLIIALFNAASKKGEKKSHQLLSSVSRHVSENFNCPISNLCMHFFSFQDFLEELKLVVRGSLFQVASLQDCFLQQSEPLAATGTGVCSWEYSVYLSSTWTLVKAPKGLGPLTQTCPGSTAAPENASVQIRLLDKVQPHNLFTALLFL